MKLKWLFLLLTICLLQASQALAQSKGPAHLERRTQTTYNYSFSGARSLAGIDSLATEVYAIKGVIEFKARFKPENNHGEITVVVVEKFPGAESPSTFNSLDLKVMLINHGYDPLAITQYDSGSK